LRTLFVVVTAFGCWLGYEMNWIRQRRTIIGDPQVDNSTYYVQESVMLVGNASQTLRELVNVSAPWPLSWLGEPGYAGVVIRKRASDDEAAHIRALFPEAQVMVDE
jgi:hypothetical protein